jgi:hypothetical protein
LSIAFFSSRWWFSFIKIITPFGMRDRLNCHYEQSKESFLMAGNEFANETPERKQRGSELGDEICLKAVTAECFYRGSSSEPA